MTVVLQWERSNEKTEVAKDDGATFTVTDTGDGFEYKAYHPERGYVAGLMRRSIEAKKCCEQLANGKLPNMQHMGCDLTGELEVAPNTNGMVFLKCPLEMSVGVEIPAETCRHIGQALIHQADVADAIRTERN